MRFSVLILFTELVSFFGLDKAEALSVHSATFRNSAYLRIPKCASHQLFFNHFCTNTPK